MMISIIIPVYNTASELLENAVLSILNQTYSDFEIIIVDDGSNEITSVKIDSICNGDTRIKVFHQENAGVSNARNCGIRMCSGDVITFVDSDDWIAENFCETIANNIEGNDILIFDAIIVNQGRYNNNFFFQHERSFSVNDKEELIAQCINFKCPGVYNPLFHGVGCVCCKAYSYSFIEENELRFYEGQKNSEDALFNIYAFSKAKKIKYVQENLYYWYENSNSATHSFDACYIDTCSMYLKNFKNAISELGYDKNQLIINSYYSRVILATFSIFEIYIIRNNKQKQREELQKLYTQDFLKDLCTVELNLSKKFNYKYMVIKNRRWFFVGIIFAAKNFLRKIKEHYEKTI